MFERIEVASPARPWATALAFLVNATALMLAILIPMLKPDRLPAFNFRTLTPPYNAPSAEVPVETHTQLAPGPVAALNDTAFRAPSAIPNHVHDAPDQPAGPPHPYIPGAPTGDRIGIEGLPIAITTNPPPIATTVQPTRPKTPLNISHLDEGMLIRRVQPAYPQVAKLTHTQGTVVLSALIGTRGDIEAVQVIKGHPLLAGAAVEAVRQWRYRPYILNGSPIEVRTQVTVNFSLQ